MEALDSGHDTLVERKHLRSASELGVSNVEDVVTRLFGIEVHRHRGRELNIFCPDPAHDDSHPSADVNQETGFWSCFSCGKGGDLIGLGARVLGRDRDDIEEMLKPSSYDSVLAALRARVPKLRRRQAEPKPVPVPGEYANPRYAHELTWRGFTPETLAKWDVRYISSETLHNSDGKEFNIYASIGIPIEDINHRVLAWCYRRTGGSQAWQPKYLYTDGFAISETWFGLQHHSPQQNEDAARLKEIVVVEGALDAIWLDQCGIPALALLGGSMGDRKLRYLTLYRRVTLLMDLDAAGAAAVRRIGAAVGLLVPLYVARYADWMQARDPQELAPVDVELAVARAVPWTEFDLRRAQRGGMSHTV